MTENTIAAVFEELNFPSATRLKRVLDTRGISYKAQNVDRLVRRETTRQVQAPRYKFDGKIAAADLNSRWFADLIDFTAAPSDGGQSVGLQPTGGARYVLVVQDVFSRFLYTEALPNKRPETVAYAFNIILDRAGVVPRALLSDAGAEFSQQFQRLLAKKGISYGQKQKGDVNAIATIDNAIGNLKKALARDTRKQGTNDWASRLQKVTQGQNSLPNNDYLEGGAPNNVADSKDLTEELRRKNQEFTTLNQERMEKRAEKLKEAGSFRAMETVGKFTRTFKPKYESQVRSVEHIDGTQVTDEAGNSYPTKLVQPVKDATNDSGPVQMEQRGSIQTKKRQARILQPFANALERVLNLPGGRGTHTVTMAQALRILQGALTPAKFAAAVAEARLSRTSLIKRFVGVFSDMFELVKKDNVMYVSSLTQNTIDKAPTHGQGRLFADDQGRLVIA